MSNVKSATPLAIMQRRAAVKAAKEILKKK